MSSKVDELRKVRFEHRQVSYTIGDLNRKLELEPKRSDLRAMRHKLTEELKRLDLERSKLLTEIKSSPYALADVVEVIDALVNIQSQLAHGGSEEGQLAISAFLRYIANDKERLTETEANRGAITAGEAPTEGGFTITDWRKIAGTRQGIIGKLEKKVRRLEDLVAALKEGREAAA